jgi:hypothetical protein
MLCILQVTYISDNITVTNIGYEYEIIRTIVEEELNNYDALKESDNIEINLGMQMLILVIVGLWFWFAEKSKDYILYVFSGITSLVGGVWFFTVDGVNMTSINTWTAIILILFGVYCFFLSLYYGMRYNARK